MQSGSTRIEEVRYALGFLGSPSLIESICPSEEKL